MEKQVLQIYKNLSAKYNLPMEVINDIIDSQFKTAQEAIKEGIKGEPDTFKNIMFIHLGKLIAKPNRVKWLKLLSEKSRTKKSKLVSQGEDETNSEQSMVGTNQPT